MQDVKTIAVIGAGIMGRVRAHVAALGGLPPTPEDLLPGALRAAGGKRGGMDRAASHDHEVGAKGLFALAAVEFYFHPGNLRSARIGR